MDKSRGTAAPVNFRAVLEHTGAKLKADGRGGLQVVLPKQTGPSRFNLRAALRFESAAQRQARADEFSLSKMQRRFIGADADVQTDLGTETYTQLSLRGKQPMQTEADNRKANAAVAEAFIRGMRRVVPPDRLAVMETRIRDREAALPPKLFANHIAFAALEFQRDSKAASDQRASLRAGMAMHLEALGQSGATALLDLAVDLCVTDRSIAAQLGEAPTVETSIQRALGLAKSAHSLSARDRLYRDRQLTSLERLVQSQGQLHRTSALQVARLRLEACGMKAGEFDAAVRHLRTDLRRADAPRIDSAAGHTKLMPVWTQVSAFLAKELSQAGADDAAVDACVQRFIERLDPTLPRGLLKLAFAQAARSPDGSSANLERALKHLVADLRRGGKEISEASESDLLRAIMKSLAGLPSQPLAYSQVDPCATVVIDVEGEFAVVEPDATAATAAAAQGVKGWSALDHNEVRLKKMQGDTKVGYMEAHANRAKNRPAAHAFIRWLAANPHLEPAVRLPVADALNAMADRQPEVFAAYAAKVAKKLDVHHDVGTQLQLWMRRTMEDALDQGRAGTPPRQPAWREHVIGLALNKWTEDNDERFRKKGGEPGEFVYEPDRSPKRCLECVRHALAQYRGWHPERFDAPEVEVAVEAEVEEVHDGLASTDTTLSVDDAQDDEGVSGVAVPSPGDRRAAAEAELGGRIS